MEKRYRRPAEEVARLRLLTKWFGDRTAELLLPGEIEARLSQAAEERGWAASTFNHHRSLMSLAYRLGRRNHKVKVSPVRMFPAGAKTTAVCENCGLKKSAGSSVLSAQGFLTTSRNSTLRGTQGCGRAASTA